MIIGTGAGGIEFAERQYKQYYDRERSRRSLSQSQPLLDRRIVRGHAFQRGQHGITSSTG